MHLDPDNGPLDMKWKENKLSLEKPMTHLPDAHSYYMCFLHSLASYLALGPEEDPKAPYLIFPQTTALKQPYKVIQSIFNALSKQPEATEMGLTDDFYQERSQQNVEPVHPTNLSTLLRKKRPQI